MAEQGVQAEKKPKKKPHRVRRVLLGVVLVLLAACVLIAWNRWWRYDDAADFVGEWKYSAAQMTVTMDGSDIRLTDDVEYAYTINDFDKTITYSFGSLTGGGSYCFSADRQKLLIRDQGSFDLAVELGMTYPDAFSGGEVEQGDTLLIRISDNAQAQPQSLKNNDTEEASSFGEAIEEEQESYDYPEWTDGYDG